MTSRHFAPTPSPTAGAGAARWLRRLAVPAALVLAAGTAVGVAASPRGHHGSGGHPMACDGAGMMGMAGPMGMAGRGSERMLERLGASAEQRAQIDRIVEQSRQDMRSRAETRRALHDQMAALFAQPAVDAAAVEALRQQMQAEHDQASQRRTQTMLAISEVLTPEQRAQMAQWHQQRGEAMKSRMKSWREREGQ